jgi:hypothetical protein
MLVHLRWCESRSLLQITAAAGPLEVRAFFSALALESHVETPRKTILHWVSEGDPSRLVELTLRGETASRPAKSLVCADNQPRFCRRYDRKTARGQVWISLWQLCLLNRHRPVSGYDQCGAPPSVNAAGSSHDSQRLAATIDG